MSKVLFMDGNAVWLTEVREDDRNIRGFVENGHWQLTVNKRAKRGYALTGDGGIVHQWSYQHIVEVEVPRDILARLRRPQAPDAIPGSVIYIGIQSNTYPHYNDVISWARQEVEILKQMLADSGYRSVE